MEYSEKLISAIDSAANHIIVGLDPDIEKIPEIFIKYKKPISEFLSEIVRLTKDKVCGYKLNLAFFEYYGYDGLEALEHTLECIPENLIKIADAKRGDIGNSSMMYARTYFEKMNFDAVTASPYMGIESISPFLKFESKFVYLLGLTSNAGAEEIQKIKIGDEYLYQRIISLFMSSGYKKNIGFVFGANHLSEIKSITSKYPELPLLIPGVGAQGGDRDELIKSIQNKFYLINSSRGILYSADIKCSKHEFEEKVTSTLNKLTE